MSDPEAYSQRTEQALLDIIEEGRQDANAGRLETAERCFQRVLQATRGTGTTAEVKACSSLVTIYSREQRDFETLPMARRLIRHGQAHQDAKVLCQGLAAVAGAFNDLGDFERLEEGLEELQAALHLLDDDALHLRYTRMLHGLRSHLALTLGHLSAAQAELELFRDTFMPDSFSTGEHRWLLIHEAHVRLHADEPETALALVDRARSLDVPAAIGELTLTYLDLWATLEVHGPEAARNNVERVLLRLISNGHHDEPHGNAQKVRYLTAIGDLLRQRCDDWRLAQAAYEMASASVVVRILQLNEFVRRAPEITELTAGDRIALSEYRFRFKEKHAEMLESVAALMTTMDKTREWIPIRRFLHTDSVILLCAWCQRLCTVGDVWLPVGHFVPEKRSLRVSHTICPSCARIFDE